MSLHRVRGTDLISFAGLTGLVTSYSGLLAARFFLGMLEGGVVSLSLRFCFARKATSILLDLPRRLLMFPFLRSSLDSVRSLLLRPLHTFTIADQNLSRFSTLPRRIL